MQKLMARGGIPLMVMTILMGGLLFPALSQAMCFYNKSDEPVTTVYFKCGTSCHNTWGWVVNGTRVCRPDKGGKLTVEDGGSCSVEVDPHGWVTYNFTFNGASWVTTVKSFHSDGSLREQCQYTSD